MTARLRSRSPWLYNLGTSARLKRSCQVTGENHPDDRRRGICVARPGICRGTGLLASSISAWTVRRACLGTRGWLCGPFTASGQLHRVLVRHSMGGDQDSGRSAVGLLPVGTGGRICEREEREGGLWPHGRERDHALNEPGSSGPARQMENQYSSKPSKIPIQWDSLLDAGRLACAIVIVAPEQ